MSLDLYFLAERGQSWQASMADLEDAEERPLDQGSLIRWERVRSAVTSVLPEARELGGDMNRELSDDATGIQVLMFARELSLSVPDRHSGPDAERLAGLLRGVVARIEAATGLTAYDPKAEAPFRDDAGSAAGSPEGSDRPHGRWARLMRREPR